MSHNLGETETLARALIAHHGSLWSIELARERSSVLTELTELIANVNEHEIHLMHKLLQITAELESGNSASALQEISTFATIANQLRRPDLMWYSQLFDSMLALLEGRFNETNELADRFRATGVRAKDANAIHAHATQIAIFNLESGRGNEILPVIRSVVDRFPSVDGWRCALAYLLVECGRLDEAQVELARLAACNFENFANRETDSISLNLLAATAARLNDTDCCSILYRRLLPAGDTHTIIAYAVAYFGPVADRLGQLASVARDWDRSFEHFEQAIRSCERVGSYPWLAHVQTHFAEALIARGHQADIERAAQLIQKAAEIANRLGMRHVRNRIDRIH
jgi:tetratricopeptide (TPR) repeat protein